MKLTLENTATVLTICKDGVEIPARLWQGHTESGIYVQCLITRIAVSDTDDQQQFERELKECRPPEPETPSAFPMRMVM